MNIFKGRPAHRPLHLSAARRAGRLDAIEHGGTPSYGSLGKRLATAHLIYGYLGAGKTTFARRLEHELPAVRFTHDEWMVRLFGRDPPAVSFPDKAARVSSLISTVWPRCLALGLDVVLDLGFWTRAERDQARRLAGQVGADSQLYWLQVTDAEAQCRLSARNTGSAADLIISVSTYDALKQRLEPLGQDELWIEPSTLTAP